MKTVIEMADEVFDRMLPDGHCREPYWSATDDELQAFAEIVRADAIAAEREACAKVCDDLDDDLPDGLAGWQYGEAIRARSNT